MCNDKMLLLNSFIGKSKKIFGKSLVKAILYGSYARGDFNGNSDMDIMFLTTWQDDEIKKIENDIYDLAYEYMLNDGVLISINIINVEHFYYWLDTLPYYNNVNREGLVLAG